MKNNNYIIVLLLCFTHYKLGILPHVHLLYILSLCTCYNISVATSLTRRVLHCMCECMKIGYMYLWYFMHCTCTIHSKCINDQTLRSDIFLPKCPTNVRQIWESTRSKSDYLVGHFGRTWEWILKRFFFYISRGEYVKHFVIDAYL